MMILGPLVAPRISTVTEALSSDLASEVIFSPSTTRTTGRVTESPAAVATLSISMTSPTATFCCLAPARTIAYTAVSFVELIAWPVIELSGLGAARGRREDVGARMSAPRVNSTDRAPPRQNPSLPDRACEDRKVQRGG